MLETPPTIVGIHHVQIEALSGCEEAARTFYGGILGLEEIEKPEPLRFLLSTLLMHMKKKATDRFMRDTIRCCDGAQGFLLLHHTMNDQRPEFSGYTVCGMFWPWSPFAHHRRRADFMCSVVSEHALDLEIQCTSRSPSC